ncbi:hypothetical protein [Campylobacter peloridis]|uniref:Tetratricopeptide repeat protein n=1 Tax=Campylobacter peloridis TaxID=488546 RepID=A0A5C7DYQ6_9BACT|nr:hypothetical protein [Campylobacter peloridis]AJC84430.1 hypothetical protein CPEL_0586 [Campylobacter peloridis LMG 23910]MBX1886040.1 hypothetical protein [Campylobacter peloridis]MBX2078664.1 hypothetical protein [Campylobacter peloridis]QOQ88523.1 hypothetical protein IMC75_06125 [Campylobacter peloridis]TXE82955.1 hypothetical protein FPD46_03645 [Campylobacter peloridis]
MSFKDNFKAVKEELNSQEQLMENFIKSERFIKKYKYYIIALIVIILVYFSGSYFYNLIREKNIQESNAIFSELLKNPNNQQLLEELKQKNTNLYAIFLMANKNTQDLNQTLQLNLDPLLKQIILAQNNQKSEFLKDYNILLKGYTFLKQNKFKEADIEFNKIPINSPLQQIVTSLKHYQGIK